MSEVVDELCAALSATDVDEVGIVLAPSPPAIITVGGKLGISKAALKPLFSFSLRVFYALYPEFRAYSNSECARRSSAPFDQTEDRRHADIPEQYRTSAVTLQKVSTALLIVKGDFPMAFNCRKQMLELGLLSAHAEVRFTALVFTLHPKSPSGWEHRRWCLEYNSWQRQTQKLYRQSSAPQPSTELRVRSLTGMDPPQVDFSAKQQPTAHLQCLAHPRLSPTSGLANSQSQRSSTSESSRWSWRGQHGILSAGEVETERELCREMAEKHPKNYYAWTHRLWLLRNHLSTVDQFVEELDFSQRWLYSHVSDHSACNHQVQTVLHLIKNEFRPLQWAGQQAGQLCSCRGDASWGGDGANTERLLQSVLESYLSPSRPPAASRDGMSKYEGGGEGSGGTTAASRDGISEDEGGGEGEGSGGTTAALALSLLGKRSTRSSSISPSQWWVWQQSLFSEGCHGSKGSALGLIGYILNEVEVMIKSRPGHESLWCLRRTLLEVLVNFVCTHAALLSSRSYETGGGSGDDTGGDTCGASGGGGTGGGDSSHNDLARTTWLLDMTIFPCPSSSSSSTRITHSSSGPVGVIPSLEAAVSEYKSSRTPDPAGINCMNGRRHAEEVLSVEGEGLLGIIGHAVAALIAVPRCFPVPQVRRSLPQVAAHCPNTGVSTSNGDNHTNTCNGWGGGSSGSSSCDDPIGEPPQQWLFDWLGRLVLYEQRGVCAASIVATQADSETDTEAEAEADMDVFTYPVLSPVSSIAATVTVESDTKPAAAIVTHPSHIQAHAEVVWSQDRDLATQRRLALRHSHFLLERVLHHLAAVEHRVSSAGGAAWQAVGEATPALAPAPAPPPSARAPTASTLVTSSVPEGLQLKEPIQPPSRSYDQQGEQWSGSGGGDGYLFLAQQLIGSLRVALLATEQWETQQQAASR